MKKNLLELSLIITLSIVCNFAYSQVADSTSKNKNESSGFKGFLERRQQRLERTSERVIQAEQTKQENIDLSKSVTAGMELEKASSNLLTGTILPIFGTLIGAVISDKNKDTGYIIMGVSAGIGLGFSISGYSKLGKAGKILKLKGL